MTGYRRHVFYDWKCDQCNAVYAYQGSLENHKKKSHTGQRHECYICKMLFVSTLNLQYHRIVFHTKDQQPNSSVSVQPPPAQNIQQAPAQNIQPPPAQNIQPPPAQMIQQASAPAHNPNYDWILNFMASINYPICPLRNAALLEKMNADLAEFINESQL